MLINTKQPRYTMWLYRYKRDGKPIGIKFTDSNTGISVYTGVIITDFQQKIHEGAEPPVDIYLQMKEYYNIQPTI
jgi:hypothetical protein